MVRKILFGHASDVEVSRLQQWLPSAAGSVEPHNSRTFTHITPLANRKGNIEITCVLLFHREKIVEKWG
jgi:hypothetical protein